MPAVVYVDDDWTGLSNGTEVTTPDGPAVIGTDAFATIGEGVFAVDSGGTTHVLPGLYKPGLTIFIDKSVTILGPQANVDPRPAFLSTRIPGSANEAIIDGRGVLDNILRINANDVFINGFEIRNGRTDLINSFGGAQRPKVSYNIIHQSSLDEGIQLRNIRDGVIEYNYVFDTFGDGINICCESFDSFIQYNQVENSRSPDAAIYVYNSTNITIQWNLVQNTQVNDGIKLGSSSAPLDTGRFVGRVLNNVVRDLVEDGITVISSDAVVAGNDVYRSRSTNGAIYLDRNLNNIQITNNCVHDNGILGDGKVTYGIKIGSGTNISTNVHVNNNNIFNNIDGGLFFNSSNPPPPALNAENNWWGSASGPSTVPGPDSAIGNVDYMPFLTEPGPVCLSQPTIEGPGNIIVENDTGECSATVSYTITASSPFFPINELTCSNGSIHTFSPPQYNVSVIEKDIFQVGTTNVVCTVTNTDGNTDSVEFTVTVNDTEPPKITCPNDIRVTVDAGEGGMIVTFPPPDVSDNCPGVTVVCSPSSGSFFPAGNTVVNCTATDGSGNTAECSFTVTVGERTVGEFNSVAIGARRVYDWVFDALTIETDSILSPAAEAVALAAAEDRTPLDVICEVPDLPGFFSLEFQPDISENVSCKVSSKIERIGILVNGVLTDLAIINVIFTICPLITIIDSKEEIIDQFRPAISQTRRLAVYVPEPLTSQNIHCRIIDLSCETNFNETGVPDLGLQITLNICFDIQVEADVKMEVLAKFCFPRPNLYP
ncbi:HYR domain-containing protein [Cytobacillus firmus]|uniref:HYR domain-containing protein n=1 Tax=Cytobacillus firmus DS1 TaxID=1307436 RepID=W7L3B5_CYTFI|nr:HYR domain-containing protein [Cytobacillus firmus]EWG12948.1 hypothetical protein PBF_00955 [Cytobacillus firmus DS1]